ncbi:tyrosine-type recombinase/integrase [Solimonas sp. SE-A11]|uniref:tyrosine-type recombinase/integrase n=1 Tax=Solimonas sp. SE-A11 TaxID=3054954 RepID=UPI00259CDCC7|nr:tyrosine-type recombinase/integrase [Solimonas sp. SE-A11]MDM4770850.1 tyrosine-type recombinase/integrase [Solimonas sp. SE-A11]
MLTDVKLRGLKPRPKLYRVADSEGLCIEIRPGGSMLWRYRYRFAGKANMLGLGEYPQVSLREARLARDAQRKVLKGGADPSVKRQQDSATLALAQANTFKAVAGEWLDKQQHLTQSTLDKAKWMLEELAFPWLGTRPIADIQPPELLSVLRRVESRGRLETAQRLKQRCAQVFRYAVATGRAERNPCADLAGALATPKTVHRAAVLDPTGIGELLRAIDSFTGTFPTACALKLAPLVFVRPGELRQAEWAEIDLDAAQWRIPASKMKMRRDHLVPLSSQAVAILRGLEPLTGRRRYLFPSVRSGARPMSENTINAALRRLGYDKHEMTGHGFRSLASTRLHEMGWTSEVIERQLAHAERNKVKAAYNHAEYLPERRRMMQAWADYLDTLRDRRNVVAGNFGHAA